MRQVFMFFFLISSVVIAGAPKFNSNGKMKPNEVFKKCGEWARKETEKMKQESSDEKKAYEKAFLKAAHGCSLHNGFDAKGDEGNEMWVKYGRRR